MPANDLSKSALLVVDIQKGFSSPVWGRRDRPECEANVARLLAAFRGAGRPVVFVRHDSVEPKSPLRPGTPGNAFQDVLTGEPDLLVTKSVNSAFYGAPDLDGWLRERELRTIVICGITTNHCCETTARMGGNLRYDVRFVIDATHTFDRVGPDGVTIPAEALAAATAANLHGEFGVVVRTEDVVRGLEEGKNARG
ncbi:MAG TPA: cysteine hydrolase family protein [Polyangiaceae bacterium]